MQNPTDLRQAVIETCLWLRENNYIFGTWGNISVRLICGNYLMTPSRLDYSEMTVEDLVIISKDGDIVKGFRKPTSEVELHRRILNKRPDIGALIHTHSKYATAVSITGNGIPALTEEMCQLLGGDIPITSRFVPSEKHVELGTEAADSLGFKNALLIRNHGVISCGHNLEEAKVGCQIIEKSAEIYLSLNGYPIDKIEQQWVEAARNYYLYSYGKK